MDSKRNRVDVDRISSLPDGVLCHILSFLSTKYSVRTRVLSTRWNHLYASVHVLDFDCTLLTDDNGERFLKFVNNVLLIHNYQRLTKFRLHYLGDLQKTHFTTWVSLALDGKYDLRIPGTACLPCLKTLILRNAVELVQPLFSICPVLEDLLVADPDLIDNAVFDISIPTLKRLRINNILFCNSTLLLKVPSLESFHFGNSWATKVSGETLTSLVKAFISPHRRCPVSEVCNLVTMVCNAQHIYLSTITTKYVFSGLVEEKVSLDKRKLLLTFRNLTRLELGCFASFCSGISPILLTCVLRSSTNLEVLVFTEGFEQQIHAENDRMVVPAYVSPHLKEIQFRRFRMMPAEILLVKHFLVNAPLHK